MGKGEVSALFNELNDAYELKLGVLEKEGEISLEKYREDALQFIKEQISEYGPEYFLKESTQLLAKEVSFIRTDTVLCGRFDRYLYISLCYYHLASVMPDRGRVMDGCKYLHNAMYYCGMWQGSREHKEWFSEKEKNEKNRLENAKEARSDKYIPLKAEIIRLIYSKMPADKWHSASKAIDAIQSELVSFIDNEPKDKSSGLDTSNLGRTIKGWLINDDDLKLAFSETVCKKCT